MAAVILFLADLPGLVEVEGVLAPDNPHYVLLTDGRKELVVFREAWHVPKRCPPLQTYAGCRVRVVGVLGAFGNASDRRQTISVWHIGPADARKQVERAP